MIKHRIQRLFMIAVAVLFSSASIVGPSLAAPGASAVASQQDASQKRIEFAAGATNATVSGNLSAQGTVRYVLRAMAGQWMDVSVTAQRKVRLAVTRANGRELDAENSTITSFQGYLPRDGDYIIEVTSARRATSYSIRVSIPQRISFARGATSADLTGRLSAQQSLEYILDAEEGQLLDLAVTPDASSQLVLYGVDGTVLKSGMGEGTSFRGELPSSGDYIISVRAGQKRVSFSMSVIIPERVEFEAGEDSARLTGTLASHQTQYFVLSARKNQTMKVRVRPAGAAQLIIYGADGTVLRSGMGEGARFTGKLPSTQDYIVALRAGARSASYTLTVTIQ